MSQALVQKTFFRLLDVGLEHTHLDFKERFFHRKPEQDEKKATERVISGENHLLKCIMAMYNAPLKYGRPFDSVSGEKETSSYLIFGVHYKDGRWRAAPFSHGHSNNAESNAQDGVIDETDLQKMVKDRLSIRVSVQLHKVSILKGDVPSDCRASSWLMEAFESDEDICTYYMIEIAQNVERGPVVAAKNSYQKSLRGLKNKISEIIFTRTQATNHSTRYFEFPNDPKSLRTTEKHLLEEVYAKFDDGIGTKYLDSLVRVRQMASAEGSFKVLVINKAVANGEKMEALATSVARAGFAVIFDLDETSAEEGGFFFHWKDKCADFVSAHYDDLKRLPLEDIQKGSTTLHVMLFGDTTVPVDPPEWGMKGIGREVANALSDLYRKLETPVCLEVFCLSLSHARVRSMGRVTEIAAEEWMKMKTEASCFNLSVHQCFTENVSSGRGLGESEFNSWTDAVATIDEIVTFFQDLSPHQDVNESGYRIPGAASSEKGVCLTDREFATVGKIFDIYHFEMGRPPDERIHTEKDRENFIKTKRLRFLQGHRLEPEMMFLQSEMKAHMVASRSLFDRLVDRLLNSLSSLPHQKPPNRGEDLIRLLHEPSAGGTTLGRMALYKIRRQYPCVELKHWKMEDVQHLYNAIKIIYFEKSRKPLCILVDTSTVGQVDVKDFAQKLMACVFDDAPQFVVLYVEGNSGAKETAKRMDFVLETRLDDSETHGFDALYEGAHDQLARTDNRSVFLYGLCQFNAKYTRLDPELDRFLKSAPRSDKDFLLLCAVVYQYGFLPLPSHIASLHLGMDLQRPKGPNLIAEQLGKSRDFVLVDTNQTLENRTNGLRPPTRFIAKLIIIKMNALSCRDIALRKFMTTFLALIEGESGVFAQNAVETLVQPMFIQRNVVFHPEEDTNKRERFSSFVNDLQRNLTEENQDNEQIGKKKTADIIRDLVEQCAKIKVRTTPHLRAMYARYLAHELTDLPEALAQIRTALDLRRNQPFTESRSVDTILLTTAGHILSRKLHSIATGGLLAEESVPRVIAEAQDVMKNAISVLGRAQKNGNNVYPFTIEARLRYLYMKVYYQRVFHRDRKELSIAIQETDDEYLQTAVPEIKKRLNDLDHLLHQRNMEGYSEETLAYMNSVKTQVLSLLIDIGNTRIEDIIRSAESDISVAHCYVAHVLKPRYVNGVAGPRRRFEHLSADVHRNILEIFKQHLDEHLMEREDYRAVILAHIYIYKNVGPRFWNGNIHLGQRFAEAWSKKFKHDFRGFYFLSALYLAQAMKDYLVQGTVNEGLMDRFWQKYEITKNLYNKRHESSKNSACLQPNRKELNFVIVKDRDSPLKILLPRDFNFNTEDVHKVTYLERHVFLLKGKSVELRELRKLVCRELSTKKNNFEVVMPKYQYRIVQDGAKAKPVYTFALRLTPHDLETEVIMKVGDRCILEEPEENGLPPQS